jgi:hypothetical protein
MMLVDTPGNVIVTSSGAAGANTDIPVDLILIVQVLHMLLQFRNELQKYFQSKQ